MENVHQLYFSHSWSFGASRDTLVKFLNGDRRFRWKELSLDERDRVHSSPRVSELSEAIRDKMKGADCVLILAGVCDTHKKWIHEEIRAAKRGEARPIVAVEPWASEKTSATLKKYADRVVKWKRSEIVRAIRDVSPLKPEN